jgi:hypothetical protein
VLLTIAKEHLIIPWQKVLCGFPTDQKKNFHFKRFQLDTRTLNINFLTRVHFFCIFSPSHHFLQFFSLKNQGVPRVGDYEPMVENTKRKGKDESE